MTAKRRATLLLAALLSPLLLSIANGFATPKSDFVLDIDGNSISTSREHLCAIEKKPGSNSIGGRARCWGFDHFDGRTKPPQDVRDRLFLAPHLLPLLLSPTGGVHSTGHRPLLLLWHRRRPDSPLLGSNREEHPWPLLADHL